MIRKNTIVKNVLGFSLCIVICISTAFIVKYTYSFLQNYFTPDFEFYTDKEDPQVGEIINLQGLKDKNEKSFQDTEHGKLILLVIVDPECGACEIAKDQMRWIQEGIKDSEIEYVFVSFTSKKTTSDFSSYIHKNYQSRNSFLWKDSSLPSPKSLFTTPVPSHILIDSNGKILKTFFGTQRDKSLRKRTADKIIKEVKKVAE